MIYFGARPESHFLALSQTRSKPKHGPANKPIDFDSFKAQKPVHWCHQNGQVGACTRRVPNAKTVRAHGYPICERGNRLTVDLAHLLRLN